MECTFFDSFFHKLQLERELETIRTARYRLAAANIYNDRTRQRCTRGQIVRNCRRRHAALIDCATRGEVKL